MPYSDGAPADGLQQAVDGLAARLRRSVAVDDMQGRLVAASRHFGDEDPLRTYAVMQRSSDDRVVAHFGAHGIYGWTAPGRVPGDPDLDFKARVCCPVLAHGLRFGHLFLIDESVGDDEVELAAAVADEVGHLLHRRLVLHEQDHERRAALAGDLVAPDPATREAAGRVLLDEHLVDALDPALAVVIRVLPGADGPEDLDTALRRALERLVRDRYAALTTPTGHGGTVLLLGAAATVEAGRAAADRLGAELRPDVESGRVVIGVGEAHTGPDAAHDTHEEARRCADAAVLLPALGDVITPDDLGVWAVLLALPRPAITADLLPAALRRLLDHGSPELVETLETYLDHGGDATRTAHALRVHRSTLHYRLGRIEAVAGVDLHDGAQRLALHLGLRLRTVLDAYEALPSGPAPPRPRANTGPGGRRRR